jgi:hypothetical protein
MQNQRKPNLLVVDALLAGGIVVCIMLVAMWFTGHL